LVEGWNQLSTEPASRPRAIVLLSDGFNNVLPDPATVLPTIPSSVPIFSIAMGPAANAMTLQDIANSRPNGGYFVVEGDEDVHKLHEIYAAIQALASSGSLIGLNSFPLSTESPHSESVPVEPGLSEISFLLSWDAPAKGTQLSVTDPGGKSYSAATAATLERQGQTYRLLRVAVPKAGSWTVQVRSKNSKAVLHTLSVIAQSQLNLSVRASLLGKTKVSLLALLHNNHKPITDAKISSSFIIPALSQKDALTKYAADIKKLELPPALNEKGLTPDQLALVKLAALGIQFRGKKGGMFGRKTVDVALTHQGTGIYGGKATLSATGNITVKVIATGKISGAAWQRTATVCVRC